MISFESDYNNGVHPEVLQHLIDTNQELTSGYGFDQFSEAARKKIIQACECPDAEVFFLVGGTQTNMVVIDAMLQLYEGVLAANTAHINVHESGAVEMTGHKVLTLPEHHGKIHAEDLRNWLITFHHDENKDHCVFPGLVYITFPTEYGTLYTAKELTDIYAICQEYEMPLFIDGARLGYGLMAPDNDITLPFLAHHCDAFYIGGTKVGALCGEAVVFTHNNTPKHFFTTVKQHGALLAKGRLVGVQFDALFTDNLYLRISQGVMDKAMQLKNLFKKYQIPFFLDSPTNQQFVILTKEQKEKLSKDVIFGKWCDYDEDHEVCRFVTSWMTTDDDLLQLERLLQVL